MAALCGAADGQGVLGGGDAAGGGGGRARGRSNREFVTAEEIDEKVRWLMDSDGGRERTLAATREALSDGGCPIRRC